MVYKVNSISTPPSVATSNQLAQPPLTINNENVLHLVQSNSFPTPFLQQLFSQPIKLPETVGRSGSICVSYTPKETVLNQRAWCQSIENQQNSNPAELAELFAQQLRALLSPDRLSVKVEYSLEDGAKVVHLCKYVSRKKRKCTASGEDEDEDTI